MPLRSIDPHIVVAMRNRPKGSPGDIAELLHITRGYLVSRLRDLRQLGELPDELEARVPPLRQVRAHDEHIKTVWSTVRSISEVARLVGVSRSAVYAAAMRLRAEGVPLPTHREIRRQRIHQILHHGLSNGGL